VLELIMTSLARDLPRELHAAARRQPLDLDQPAAQHPPAVHLRRRGTLPRQPFEYITRQTQGDFVIMDQRDNNLFADAGMVTSQADWSLSFDLGMSFMEWHAPVPLAHELGIFDRALSTC
jgi:hypothetical protein